MTPFKHFITEDRLPAIEAKFKPLFLKQSYRMSDWFKKHHPEIEEDGQRISDEHWDINWSDMSHVIVRLDPTPNKAYTQWLFQIMLNVITRESIPGDGWGNFYRYIDEDDEAIRQDLRTFDRVKARMPANLRDINRYKDHLALRVAIAPYEQTKSNNELDADAVKKLYDSKQITLIYKGPEGKVEVPRTLEAAKFLGRGTKWCTAAEKNNYFDRYNSQGPLYVITLSDGKKYQFHLQTVNLMDSNDVGVYASDIGPVKWAFKHIKITEQDVVSHPLLIRFIDSPPESMKIAAVKHDASAIKYIANPSEVLRELAVRQNGAAIGWIHNPSEALQIIAINQKSFMIQWIHNPSEKVQLVAVQLDGHLIRFLNNPSENVQLAAVRQIGVSIMYLKNPSEKVILTAVGQSPAAIGYVHNASEKVLLAAVRINPKAIKFIDNPSEAVLQAARR